VASSLGLNGRKMATGQECWQHLVNGLLTRDSTENMVSQVEKVKVLLV
jgi:hypothetical protein